MNSIAIASLVEYGNLEEAYPSVDSHFKPAGNFILFQLRTPKNETKGGIALPQSVRVDEYSQWNTQVARVVQLGPTAFKDRDTLEPWPEGNWCDVGDFVRIPAHGGDRWYIPIPNRIDHRALFAVYRDTEVKGIYTGDPLLVDTYL